MIIYDDIIQEWDIYDAEQFRKEFKIKTKFTDKDCDGDFIERHLEKDKRKFRLTFMESARGKSYEEFWRIQHIK